MTIHIMLLLGPFVLYKWEYKGSPAREARRREIWGPRVLYKKERKGSSAREARRRKELCPRLLYQRESREVRRAKRAGEGLGIPLSFTKGEHK